MPILTFLFAVAVYAAPSPSPGPSAMQTQLVEGKIELRTGSGTDPVLLQKGMWVGKGAQLRGAPGALGIWVGSDGSRIKLQGESVLEVLDWGEVREFRLDRGMAMFQVAPGPARSFRVRTRAAVMGVRGTQFFVSYAPSGSDEWMCVKEGEVEIASAKQEQSLTLVKAGQGVRVEGSKVSAPEKFGWTEKLNWEMDGGTSRLEENLLRGTYDDVRVRNYD